MKAWILFSLVASLNSVQFGADRVLADPFRQWFVDKRVGLIAHPASVTSYGTHVLDLLVSDPRIEVVSLFAPEHGFRGGQDDTVADGFDEVTGLPIYSLYGNRKAPSPEQLSQIDVLVIDLQDVGLRFYTYATTMAMAMKAAAQMNKEVIVLDRPNPLGGEVVEGAVLEDQLTGRFSAYYPIPTRHGMTMGELAHLFNESFGIHANLKVVRTGGWRRNQLWDQTNLTWTSPSPALPSYEQTFLYGIFGTLAHAKLAVGRGTPGEQDAFRVYGAPTVSAEEAEHLVQKLTQLELPGLKFSVAQWVPTRREFTGQTCNGFRVEVTDRDKIDGIESLIKVAQTMQSVLGDRVDFAAVDHKWGAVWLREGIQNNAIASELVERAKREVEDFNIVRKKYLLYR